MRTSEIHKLAVVDVNPCENNSLRGVVGGKKLLQFFCCDFLEILWWAQARKTQRIFSVGCLNEGSETN